MTTLFPAGVSVDTNTYPVLAISRDGSTIAFAGASKGVSRLYVRRLGEFDAHVLPETEGATAPFFSPDSTWIGFFGDGKLKKTPVTGGPVITLAPGADVRGGVWTDVDTIIFSPNATAPINEIPASGGASRSVTELDQTRHERTHRWPSLMPDQKTVLFNVGNIAHPNDYDEATIEAVRLDTRERRVVIYYLWGTELFAASFELSDGLAAGKPRRAFGEALALSLDSQQYYDMAPDGRRFLMMRASDDRTVTPEIRLVLNWFTDLRRTAR